MSDHKEKDSKSKAQRGISRRAQLRQQQKTIELLNLKLKDYLNAIHTHYMQVKEYKEKYENALKLTPSEKSRLAFDTIKATQALNQKICEMGACIHKEHKVE